MYNYDTLTEIMTQVLRRVTSKRLSHEDIEDIRQEMYLMGISLKDKLDFEENWKGFLYISMLGAALNYINSISNTISISDVNSSQERIADMNTTTDEEYDDADVMQIVMDFLTQDPRGWGTRYFGLDGYPAESYRQIAAREGVSHACVHDYVTKLVSRIKEVSCL